MKKIIIYFLACNFLFSCQDINQLPKENLSDPLYWKSQNDFKMAANYLYRVALEGYSTGYTLDYNSDIAYALSSNGESNGSWIAPDSDPEWDNAYKYIRNSNIIIEKYASYPGNKSEVEVYEAEARFFRAYQYWKLVKRFGDVPLVTTVLDVDSEELTGPRTDRKEVENFILNELQDISSSLPLQSELTDTDNGRITRGAALALKARVALFIGTWAKYHGHRDDASQLFEQAISAAKNVMESQQYSLFEGKGDDSYRNLFIEAGDGSTEDILSSRYYKNIRTHNASSQFAWGWCGTPTRKMADMYLCKDGLPIKKSMNFKGYETINSEFENRDPRMAQTFLIPGTVYSDFEPGKPSTACSAKFSDRPETRTGYKLWKFIGEEKGQDTQAAYDYHVIRYAEVLLILAEATFEKDGYLPDEILDKTINVIRNRAGVKMPPLTNKFVSDHQLDMLTEIRRERTVELAFEGFRRDDLRRWKTAETELKQAVKGIKYKGTEYEASGVLNSGNPGLVDENGFLIVEPVADRQFVADKHYLYSVPLMQLHLNPNLAPNNQGW